MQLRRVKDWATTLRHAAKHTSRIARIPRVVVSSFWSPRFLGSLSSGSGGLQGVDSGECGYISKAENKLRNGERPRAAGAHWWRPSTRLCRRGHSGVEFRENTQLHRQGTPSIDYQGFAVPDVPKSGRERGSWEIKAKGLYTSLPSLHYSTLFSATVSSNLFLASGFQQWNSTVNTLFFLVQSSIAC